MISAMRWVFLFSCLLVSIGTLTAEETAAERSVDSLKTIAEPLATSLTELRKLQGELEQAESEDAKGEIRNRIEAERERVGRLRENFRDIVGGSEAAEYEGETAEGTGIQEQISELVQPVLSEMREATSEPRQLDKLRKSLDAWQERKRKTETVIDRIDSLISKGGGETLLSELKSARSLWAGRQAEAISQIAVLKVQIDERTKERRSLWEVLSTGFSDFFRSRGMNLLIAILTAAAGFIAVRRTYAWLRRVSPLHKKGRGNFSGRLADVLAMAASVLVALFALIAVFYLRNDWLLLTLVVIFLIGVAWAGKTTIPPYLEQIRMILNLGSVREGERVVYNGLPWNVTSLGFYTLFTNPNLQGGLLRIPIRDVMAMVSRPVAPREVWFPTVADDWVILSDGTFGKTITQTPDQVVVLKLGGSMKTYPTADFLKLAPENLSHGFRLSVTFGIDYRHRADCTTSIPEIFQQALAAGLTASCGRDAVRSVQAEFAAAAASSLDYTVLADFDGSVAHRYMALQRKILGICVDVCNANDWGIPFPQITVHRG
jgi:predicted  nucleic acid-binding Zn-ribbon protein